MASRLITISFDMANDGHNSLISRIRNFGEDLYREFRKTGHAVIDIEAVDRAVDRLSLEVAAPRHIGEILAFIKKTLRQHGLVERAHVERAHGA